MGCNWFNQSECFVGFVTMMKYLTRAHLKRTWRHIKVTMECTTYAEFGNPRLNHQEINNSEPASCGLSCGQPAKPSRATFRFLSPYLLVNYLPILNNYILVHLDISWYILIFKWVYKYIYLIISWYVLILLPRQQGQNFTGESNPGKLCGRAGEVPLGRGKEAEQPSFHRAQSKPKPFRPAPAKTTEQCVTSMSKRWKIEEVKNVLTQRCFSESCKIGGYWRSMILEMIYIYI